MKRLPLLIISLATAALAQNWVTVTGNIPVATNLSGPIDAKLAIGPIGAGAPTANCVAGKEAGLDTTAHKWYVCSQTNTWSQIMDTATVVVKLQTPFTTKGDLWVTDGTNMHRLGVGSNTQVLTADSTQTDGIKWAAAGGSGAGVKVDTSAIAGTSANFSSTTPTPPLNSPNAAMAQMQKDSGSPDTNISMFFPSVVQEPSARVWAYITPAGSVGGSWSVVGSVAAGPPGVSLGASNNLFNVAAMGFDTTASSGTATVWYGDYNWLPSTTANISFSTNVQLASCCANQRFNAGVTSLYPGAMVGSDAPGAGGPSGLAEDAAFFRVSSAAGDTNFKCVVFRAGTSTVGDSGVTADTATHSFKFQMNGANQHTYFFIDGAQVCDVAAHLLGTADVLGLVGIQNLTAAQKIMFSTSVMVGANPK